MSRLVGGDNSWLEDRQGKFNLWVRGIKAANDNKASLDHRVQDRPDIRELICDLLDGLREALECCLNERKSTCFTGP
jgi:hypothetical protein